MAYQAALLSLASHAPDTKPAQRFFPLPPSHSLPLHLSPLPSFASSSSSSPGPSSSGPLYQSESAPDRLSSSLRLLSAWEALAQRYTAIEVEEDDEWDLETGECTRFGGLLDREVGLEGREFGAVLGGPVKEEEEESDSESSTDGDVRRSSSSANHSSPPPPPASSSSSDELSDDDLDDWSPAQFGPVVKHVPALSAAAARGRGTHALPSTREGMKTEDLEDLEAFLAADGLRPRAPTPVEVERPPDCLEEDEGEDDDGSAADDDATDAEDEWDEIDFISEKFPASASAGASAVTVKRERSMPVSSALLPRTYRPPPLPASRLARAVKRESDRAASLGPVFAASTSVSSAGVPSSPASTSSRGEGAYMHPPLLSLHLPGLHQPPGSASSSPAPPTWTSSSPRIPSSLALPASSSPLRHADGPSPAKRPRLTSLSSVGAIAAGPHRPPAQAAPPSRIPVLSALRRRQTASARPSPASSAALLTPRQPARRASVKRERSAEPFLPGVEKRRRVSPVAAAVVKPEPGTSLSPFALAHSSAAPLAPAKRPRGRPRKHSLVPSPSADQASLAVKQEQLAAVDPSTVPVPTPAPIKRPRGRPRKQPLPVPLPTVDDRVPMPVVPETLGAGLPAYSSSATTPATHGAEALATEALAAVNADHAEANRLALARALFPDDEPENTADADRLAKRRLAAELFGASDDEDDDNGSRPSGGKGRVMVLDHGEGGDDDDDDDPLAGYDVW